MILDVLGTPSAQPAEAPAAPEAAPAAPAAPEAATGASPAAASAAPAAGPAAGAAEQAPAEAAVKAEEKPAPDAADAALDQKMAQEDKPRLIQVRQHSSMALAEDFTHHFVFQLVLTSFHAPQKQALHVPVRSCAQVLSSVREEISTSSERGRRPTPPARQWRSSCSCSAQPPWQCSASSAGSHAQVLFLISKETQRRGKARSEYAQHAQVLSLTEEEIQRSERARQEAEAARKAAEEKLVAEAEARRRRDAERIKLQVAPNVPPAEPKKAGPTREELDATAAKVRLLLHTICVS